MSTNHIARFEQIVQRLVEGTFARLFAGRLRPLEVANALAQVMEDHAVPRPGALPLAPNHYWVALNPTDRDALLTQQPDLTTDLARHVFEMAQQLGFSLPDPPAVYLTAEPTVPPHQVQVTARRSAPARERTDSPNERTLQFSLPAQNASADPAQGHLTRDPERGRGLSDQPSPTRPFVILDGQRHLSLLKTTVNLGRSLDNDIILDDARVSRRHAQLRRRYDRYVIYDLGSTGGTSVNGYPVQECVLEAGDVISLAGVEIIYGEDASTPTTPPQGADSTPALRRTSLIETGELPPLPNDTDES
jgi:pSer/pThr/pTyr-binding forkhead associated (FHA) protein